MNTCRRNWRRIGMVAAASLVAGAMGVWAAPPAPPENGTETTHTKYETEQVNASGNEYNAETGETSWANAYGNEQTVRQLGEQQDTTSSQVSAEGYESNPVLGESCTTSIWVSGNDPNTVQVNQNATQGSINTEQTGWYSQSGPTGWSGGPADVIIQVSAVSDNPGAPNISTSIWHSADRSVSVTTHSVGFQNSASSGQIALTAYDAVSGELKCDISTALDSGFLLNERTTQHFRQRGM